MEATFVKRIVVDDPHFGHPVNIDIYKEDGALMFGIEALVGTDDTILSPYGNGELRLIGSKE
jgi:hypothetical protein